MKEREYLLTYQKLIIKEVEYLNVFLDTPEFGRLTTDNCKSTGDKELDMRLFNSMGDELMDKYDAMLDKRPVTIAVS